MMTQSPDWLLELRIFRVEPGRRAEFGRISREGTVPLMHRHGIVVLAHGPCLNDDNGYFLLRAFRSEAERDRCTGEFYASDEWRRRFEQPVMSMINDYATVTVPAPAALALPPG